MSRKKSIRHIEEELEKYQVSMSSELRMELRKNEQKRNGFTRRMTCLLAALVCVVGVVFYFAQKQEGNYVFSVYLDRDALYQKGVDLSETGEFRYVGSELHSDRMPKHMVAAESDILENLDEEVEGSWTGDGYMAYSFYIRNAGWEDTGYQATLHLDSVMRHAEPALRVKVWRNGEPVICKGDDGKDRKLYEWKEKEFRKGFVDKYTVAVWLDEQDPDFQEEMKDGKPQVEMKINALEEA